MGFYGRFTSALALMVWAVKGLKTGVLKGQDDCADCQVTKMALMVTH